MATAVHNVEATIENVYEWAIANFIYLQGGSALIKLLQENITGEAVLQLHEPNAIKGFLGSS